MNYTKWRNATLNAKMQTDKKYLILKMGDFLISTAGLGWYIIYTLHGIKFALENDFIPVVDWKNCKLPQYDAAKVGKENVWEYFFEQPFGVTVEQAYESGDFFVIDDVGKFEYQNTINAEKFVNFYDKDIIEWRKCFQKYVRLKQDIKEYFEQCKKELLGVEDFVGVLARGTDYMALKPTGHLKAISKEEIFEQIDQCKNQKKIFLATEDEEILKAFENKYTKDLYSVDTKRYSDLGHDTLNVIYKKEDGYKRDLNYLYSIYLISKSSSCICSACGGGILASLMRKDVGMYYTYLCHGHNRAKGVIVGSYIEKEQNKIALVGNKPLMFYALNMFKILCIEEADVIVSNGVRIAYEKEIGSGGQFGMKINYIISDTYNISEYLIDNLNVMESSRLVLLYADYIVHGKDVIKNFFNKVNTFDGAYVWGVKTCFLSGTEKIMIDKERGIPEEVLESYRTGDYSLIGRYVFDYEWKEIVKKILQIKSTFELVDILNEYIKRKKLFFIEYNRGIISLKIEENDTLKKVDQLIKLLEEFQGQKIGDFEAFRKCNKYS